MILVGVCRLCGFRRPSRSLARVLTEIVIQIAEIAAEVAHPELKGLFGHHGKRWVGLSELAAFCEREGAPAPRKPCDVARPETDDSICEPQTVKSQKTAIANNDPPAIRHVRKQLAALLATDFVQAFALNSTANQARLGDAATADLANNRLSGEL